MIYAKIKSDKGESKVNRGGDGFIEIDLHRHNRIYAQIGWCEETNILYIYGFNGKLIQSFTSIELGHI